MTIAVWLFEEFASPLPDCASPTRDVLAWLLQTGRHRSKWDKARRVRVPAGRSFRRASMGAHILVTGGAGYIGSHTCKALAAAGYAPVVVDDLSTGHEWAVKWGPLVVADVADRVQLSGTLKEFGIVAVIHFAAHAYVGESVRDPRKYFDNNVTRTLALLDAVLDAGIVHLVFSSSCATYGVPHQLPISEAYPQIPINPYGASKLFVEQILHWYERAYGLRHVNLRYFNAAGADPAGDIGESHDPETHLVPQVIASAQHGQDVDVFGTDYDTADGTAIRDYVHVCDLAAAHVRALDHLLAGGASASVNLGTGRGHSVREVISMVETVGGHVVHVREAPRRPGDPPALIADPRLGRELLGWEARQSDLRTIVQTAWNWHRKQRPRTAPPDRRQSAPALT
jgi:UDP-glucose-4-epimerase GalE